MRVAEDFEQVDQPDQLQSLHHEFGGVDQLERPSLLFGGCEETRHQPNAAGVHGGQLLQVQDQAAISGSNQVFHGCAQAITRFSQTQTPTQFYDFDLTLTANLNVQADPRR